MPLFDRLTQLIDNKGNNEEKQLVSHWRDTLAEFLSPFEKGLIKGHHGLELGLEPAPVLKLAIKRGQLPPIPGLLQLRDSLPDTMQRVADVVIHENFHFHVGIRLDARHAHREIYAYERDGRLEAVLRGLQDLPPLPEGMKPTMWGLDELQGISVYFAAYDNLHLSSRRQAVVEALEDQLHASIRSYEQVFGEHYRLRDGQWSGAKQLVELKNFGPELVVRMASALRPSYFSYLAPRHKANSAVVGLTPELELKGIYFTA